MGLQVLGVLKSYTLAIVDVTNLQLSNQNTHMPKR